jgi:WD40 repeat protein/transcriptional regulator with XRE-family HTH domain
MAEQVALGFGGLLRQLRAEAGLTQEELAEAAGLSPRSVSDLERGIHPTARKDTALLLADALGLAEPTRPLFVAAARGRAPAEQVLAAARGARVQAAVSASPYRGLAVFEEQDAALFFGREAATTEVLERMSRGLAGAGLLVVSGVSGAGKSSLLRAGVLPRIRTAGLAAAPGAASWPRVLFTPTREPLDELALRVAVLAGADAAAARRGLEADPAQFTLTARQAALARPQGQAGDSNGSAAERDQPSRQPRLLLVVDQFEELFTQCADEEQRRAFITALHAVGSIGHGPDQAPAALIVLGVRADFEARCADYPQLAGPVQDRYLVTSMTERQLRMAISEPAKKAGSKVDDDLVGVLLTEVRNGQPGTFGAGALPLLSHALDQAWRCRTGEPVTLADYEHTGGIDGAVAGSAQRAYDRLTPGQQTAARQVFLRLTATSPDGVDSADRVTRAELTDGKSAAEAQDVEQVLEAFAAERLLTLAVGTVELSHEALLTAWPLLRDTWLADTHADRAVRTRLHTTATDWARHARDPSYLYTGSLLQAANETAARIGADPAPNPPLSPTERDFLHASGRAQRRTARRRYAAIAGFLAFILAVVTAGIAVRNAADATRQHTMAFSRELAFESLSINPVNPVTARRLAVAAWRVFPTTEASSAMTTLLAEQQQNGILPADPAGVSDVAFSPNGKLLATADSDGTVRLWNPATDQAVGAPLQTGSGTQGGVSAVAFSPDGKLLASASGSSGTVRVWNSVTRRPLAVPLRNDLYGVFGLAFSPNGKLLASEDGNATVRFWNPVTRQPVGAPLQTHGSDTGVSFSPNGKLVAVGRKGTVRLWDPVTRHSAPLRTGSYAHSVSAVAFSPTGKLLATSGSGGTVRLWNPVTRRPVGGPLRVTSSRVGVYDVEFSPNGKLLASVDGDGTVRLWNPVTRRSVGAPLRVTSSHVGVNEMAFSPGGRLLATADSDGTVRMWDLINGQPVGAALETGALGGVNGVAFSHDSKLLASVGDDGVLRLWNPVTGESAGAPLKTGAKGGLSGAAFSPNGKLLATVDLGGTVRLWNPVTRRTVGAPLPAETGSKAIVYGVAFSPNGKLLATADGGMVRLWNPVTRRPVGASLQTGSGTHGGVSAVAFSPNGKLLTTIDHGGTVRVWNPVTGQPAGVPIHARPEGGPLVGLERVAFSPDSKLLASADGGTVQLWNPVTGQAVGAPLPAGTGRYAGVYDVAFSPDGKLLASAGSDGIVQLWNPVTGQPVGAPLATGARNGVYGVAFSADGKWLASADSDGAVHLWNISLLTHPYAALCADVGPPTQQDWAKYAPGEPQPRICP